MKLYRMMKAAADGFPEVGDTFGKLGVRPNVPGQKYDVLASASHELVRPGEGGLSVFAGPPELLPPFLKPPKARHPVWEIDTAEFGAGLSAVAAGEPHHHIEPDVEMTLAQFQTLLAATRTRWVRVEWEAL